MRLVQTEEAYFHSASTLDAYKELGVEEYEVVATLDNHTSEICHNMDGKHFPMSQYEIGATAPPFHPNCRTTTAPYFDDLTGTRAARNEGGKTYQMPSNMTYPEWKKAFVYGGDKDGLSDTDKDGIIDVGMEKEESRKKEKSLNQDTRVNKDRLGDVVLRRRIKDMEGDVDTAREIINRILETLDHRDGTLFEDLSFIDSVRHISKINKDYDYYDPIERVSACKPNKPMYEMLKSAKPDTIIGVHNHPNDTPPSYDDIFRCHTRNYKYGLVICHNGMIYKYHISSGYIETPTNNAQIMIQLEKYKKSVYNEDEERKESAVKSLNGLGVYIEVVK